MTIPFKPSLLAMGPSPCPFPLNSGGGGGAPGKRLGKPSKKGAPPPPPPLIRQALLQVLIRQAPRQVGMAGILKQKCRLKIREGKTRRQALMAECKMMRPNIMIMRR